jgi:predicted AAA+ superfamily ATPase
MKEFVRDIESQVKDRLNEDGKIVVIYGPRQSGKTTLSKKILGSVKNGAYFNCEELRPREALISADSKTMNDFFGGHDLIVLDEAQTVTNIGRMLKIFIDAYPKTHIIATGSSSFDLANKISEPLTGRHYEFFLSPLSFHEIIENYDRATLISGLNERLIYGSYPEVVLASGFEKKREVLAALTTSYLYKDVFLFNNIKKPEILTKILQALARQVGGEVSYSEIAGAIGVDKATVMNYIDLLEEAFVIFRLAPLTRNRRDEIKKLRKIYFYDNGILNTLINDYSSSDTGRDVGGLWENLMISERLKRNRNMPFRANTYYWRLKSGQEVDYVEEYDGKLHPYEFKYNKDSPSNGARVFNDEYKTGEVAVINKNNFLDFIDIKDRRRQPRR